jgi:hypothetical protein
MTMGGIRKQFETVKARAEASSLKRRAKQAMKRAARMRIDKPPTKAELKQHTFRGQPTTTALENWSVAEYRKLLADTIEETRGIFRPAGAIQMQLKHVKTFKNALDMLDASPRSLYMILRQIGLDTERLTETLKLKKPFDFWVLASRTDDLIRAYEHLIFSTTSQQHLLTEDVDVQELPIEETEGGWLLGMPDGKTLLILEGEVDRRVLNPQLRKRLGKDDTKPKARKLAERSDNELGEDDLPDIKW